jgi:hypothetical protein
VNVQVDSAYEYRVVRLYNSQPREGYLLGGIKLHATENRGTLLLLVDSTIADSLEPSLFRLMKDISGDGWAVKRFDVSRFDTVSLLKQLIVDTYNGTNDLKALLLFGHIPVPYSGELNPDGHPEHLGAWPADVYYGDMDGDYTDYNVYNTSAARPENWNVPFDGKFDNTVMPSDVELQVGRVDLFQSSFIHLIRNRIVAAIP